MEIERDKMLIKITNIDSGLKVGQEYNLCDMAAKTLINKGQAMEIITNQPKTKGRLAVKNEGKNENQ